MGFAFLALLFYGGSNFLSSVIGKEAADPPNAGRSNGQIQLLMEGVVGILGTSTIVLRGGCFTDGRSAAALVASGVILATGVLTLATALASDYRMAPFITGVLPINAVFLIVACRLLLGERTTPLQMTAIGVAVAGLAVMATADTSSEGLRGILFGLVVAGCFAAGNFGIKYASLRGVEHHVPSVCLLWLAMGAIGLAFFIIESLSNSSCLKGLDQLNAEWGGISSRRLYWFSVGSAVLQTLAIGSMKLAVSLGPAAPGMAIANANAIAVLALNQIFFHTKIKPLQLVGLLISIGGVGLLSLAPKSAQPDDDMRNPIRRSTTLPH